MKQNIYAECIKEDPGGHFPGELGKIYKVLSLKFDELMLEGCGGYKLSANRFKIVEKMIDLNYELPENWHIVVTEYNKLVLEQWYNETLNRSISFNIGNIESSSNLIKSTN